VVGSFDGPLIARRGVRDDFGAVAFCAVLVTAARNRSVERQRLRAHPRRDAAPSAVWRPCSERAVEDEARRREPRDSLSSKGGGHLRASAGNAESLFAGTFPSRVAIDCLECVRACVARRRACPRVHGSPKMYPSRTREPPVVPQQATLQRDLQGFCLKPSGGLEPPTPSLPFDVRGNQSQPTATDLACFGGFCAGPICRCLPVVAPAGVHKRSIISCPSWLRRG
jgi:hypothetical protein